MTDIDLVSHKVLRNGSHLIYLVEQKNPTHALRWPQKATLWLLNDCVRHCTWCPYATLLDVNPASGLILLYGHIAGAKEGRQETRFSGPQTLVEVHSG